MAAEQIQCWRCGARIPAGVSFCGQCGADLRGPACPGCGVRNPAGFRFCGRCGGPLLPGLQPAAPPDQPFPAAAPPPAPAVPNRQHVTILYADVVGFTALSEQLPPEFLKWMMDEGLRRARAAVERYGGRMQKVAGDTYIAVFGLGGGVDHALAGVRAAVAVRQAMAAYAGELQKLRRVRFALRLAVHTGDVVGSLLSDHPGAAFTVVGDTVNTVARLQAVAEPDQVVVSETTAALTRGAARYQELPPVTLRGKSAPVRAFRLLEWAE